MNRTIRLLFIVHFCFSACASHKITEADIPLPDNGGTSGEIILKAEKESVARVYVVGNALCKIYVRGQNGYVLELERMDSIKGIKAFVKYGKENEDLLLAIASRSRNQLLLHDLLQGRMARVDVERAILDDSYTPEVFPCDICSQEIIPADGGALFYLNPYSWEEGAPRFYRSDQKGQEKRHRKGKKNGFSVVNGELVYNKEQNRVAFFDRYNPLIEIWTDKGVLLHRCRVGEERSVEIREVEINGVKDYYFVDSIPCCFSSANGDDSILVAAYQNADGESCIYIMDWDGKLLQSFRVPGKVLEISLASSGEDIYCWTAFEEEDRLVRYSLKE